MEKRVVMAESMLEATLQYQSGQTKAQPSPRYHPLQNGRIGVIRAYFSFLFLVCKIYVFYLSCRSSSHDSSATRTSQELSQETPARKISLLSRPFGLGWRDKNKVKF